jgi:O-glycosyl hydrolase
MKSIRSLAAATLAALVLPIVAMAQVPAPQAAATGTPTSQTAQPANADKVVSTVIHLDGTDGGRVFGGVGAISGGGGNSRLLIDYPAAQRDQILDYLFKPGYGASLQVLKIEIGGDANSTDGSEPSIEHTQGTVNCSAGYEFWLAEQAKLRNPNIKLYGLAWAAPGWIGGGRFWSPDMVTYLMSWLDCAKAHGLSIDYLGGWNERGFNKEWYESLHTALVARHSTIQVVGDDSGWKVADEMVDDPKFAASIDIIGVHYSCKGGDGGSADSCHSTPNALKLDKPLWDSESGSQDDDTGSGPLIRAITRGYIDAKMSGLLNWPLLAAITSNLPYPTVGLMVAPQPWSGNYSVGKSLWVMAQITQFTEPGWRFLEDGAGYLADDRENGSYVSLRSQGSDDATTIVETSTAMRPSEATFVTSSRLQGRPVHVWSTNLDTAPDKQNFLHIADLHPDASGRYQFTLLPGYIYTFSTVAKGGKGEASPPPPHTLGLPYSDNFDSYQVGGEARYASDMQGSFEIQPCAAGRTGKCLQQMAPVKPIEWQDDSDALTLLGDPGWANYAVSVDAEFAKPGAILLVGRAGLQNRPQSHQQGYFFQVSDTGSWLLYKGSSSGAQTPLAHGTIAPWGTGRWRRLGLSFEGDVITASVDGQRITKVQDSAYDTGQIGLGLTGYELDQFDNISITPIQAANGVHP